MHRICFFQNVLVWRMLCTGSCRINQPRVDKRSCFRGILWRSGLDLLYSIFFRAIGISSPKMVQTHKPIRRTMNCSQDKRMPHIIHPRPNKHIPRFVGLWMFRVSDPPPVAAGSCLHFASWVPPRVQQENVIGHLRTLRVAVNI